MRDIRLALSGFVDFIKDEEGAEIVEYLLVFMTLVGFIPIFTRIKDMIHGNLNKIENNINENFKID